MASPTQDLEKSKTHETDTFVNSFANDGSFLEIYKKRLKEQKIATNETKEVQAAEGPEKEKRKATNLLLQGKRKIPVGRMAGTSKQLDAKKKKQEKVKKARKEENNPNEKSTAWKAYMDEVKKYKEMSCTDDSEPNRPLVK